MILFSLVSLYQSRLWIIETLLVVLVLAVIDELNMCYLLVADHLKNLVQFRMIHSASDVKVYR